MNCLLKYNNIFFTQPANFLPLYANLVSFFFSKISSRLFIDVNIQTGLIVAKSGAIVKDKLDWSEMRLYGVIFLNTMTKYHIHA